MRQKKKKKFHATKNFYTLSFINNDLSLGVTFFFLNKKLYKGKALFQMLKT